MFYWHKKNLLTCYSRQASAIMAIYDYLKQGGPEHISWWPETKTEWWVTGQKYAHNACRINVIIMDPAFLKSIFTS